MGAKTQYAIGIDLGGTDIKAALVTPSGEIDTVIKRTTPVESGADGIADRIAGMVHDLKADRGFTPESLTGVGIGVPGVTTPDGTVVLAPNLNWHHIPFKQILEGRLNLRVEIDNDASVAALGEARQGAGAGCDSLVLLTLGTGIGGGIVLNGQIYHGASFAAGELGHMCMEPDGPTCGCGKKGCLEALTAGPAMVRTARQALSEGRSSCLADTGDLTPEAICNAADGDDGLGRETVARSARYLGIAIANIINIISPDVIAIGGGISAAGDLLLTPILESARENTLEGMFDHTRILLATLGNNAGVLGAAHLVL